MLDNRKISTSKLLITGIVLVIVLILFGALGYFFNVFDSVQITKQENFYGISGTILEVRDNSIIIETPVIPYQGSSPSLTERWIWTVLINGNTEIGLYTYEDVSDTKYSDTHPFAEKILVMTISDLRAGNLITVTSLTDIKRQFSFNDKQMTASKIEVH